MAIGFIIMQIGNDELDLVCESAIVPALEACGFDAKRVDKHNEGGLLKSEIIGFIERSGIIVADLSNERPNCYLEIGYAMGPDKFRNLILTAREDHNPESPIYRKGGPKIHFDLIGYDILFWNPDRLDDFRDELVKRIERRKAILAPVDKEPISPWNDNWVQTQREVAIPALQTTGKMGSMEVRFALNPPKPDRKQQELLEAARTSTIDTFGWPIGVYLGNVDEYRPRPKQDGIVAEIYVEERSTYDYWTINRNGDFYLLKTIFEDQQDSSKIFYNTRIMRVTETLLYCARIYNRLEIDPTVTVSVAIRHGGLKGRTLDGSGSRRLMRPSGTCQEDAVETQISSTLGQLGSELVNLVKSLVAPIFVMFDFYELPNEAYERIINGYVQGRIE